MGHLARMRALAGEGLKRGLLTHSDVLADAQRISLPSTFVQDNSLQKILVFFDLDPRYAKSNLYNLIAGLDSLLLRRSNYIFFFDTPDWKLFELLKGHHHSRMYFLNPYPSSEENWQDLKDLGSNRYLSKHFFIIPDELRDIRYQNMQVRQSSKHSISITCGGSDPFNITLKYLELLEISSLPRQVVHVRFGDYFDLEQINKARKFMASSRHAYSEIATDSFYSTVFLNSRIVCTVGGLTKYELIYCGVPALTIDINSEQESTSQFLSRREVLTHLGRITSEGDSIEHIVKTFDGIIHDLLGFPSKVDFMSVKAVEYFSDQGDMFFETLDRVITTGV